MDDLFDQLGTSLHLESSRFILLLMIAFIIMVMNCKTQLWSILTSILINYESLRNLAMENITYKENCISTSQHQKLEEKNYLLERERRAWVLQVPCEGKHLRYMHRKSRCQP
ncbi:hypothetical protein O6H91_Y557200 [Diphasiastrum complanatum]|nr:hypothetical protein O6H91_Y557200 [Diphasiastrum complanatum]